MEKSYKPEQGKMISRRDMLSVGAGFVASKTGELLSNMRGKKTEHKYNPQYHEEKAAQLGVPTEFVTENFTNIRKMHIQSIVIRINDVSATFRINEDGQDEVTIESDKQEIKDDYGTTRAV